MLRRNRTSLDLAKNEVISSLPKHPAYITSVDDLLNNRIKTKASSKHNIKPKNVFIPCKRHKTEGIKYVDIKPGTFEGLCDTCMVRSEFFGKDMKLERLIQLYGDKWLELNKVQDELKDIEAKITKMHKDIVRENLKAAPILKELEDMEKKVMREVERSFRKIKAKFVRFNPFKETRDQVKEYLQEAQATIHELERGTYDSFDVLKSIYTGENKIVSELQSLVRDVNGKIEMDKLCDPLQDKDFGVLVFEYGRFFEKITAACSGFANNLKINV